MSIREEARQEAERRWPSPNSGLYEGLIIGFEKGAVWAHEQDDREPSDAEVEAVADAVEAASAQWEFEFDQYRAGSRTYADPGPKAEYIARAALIATQEVRDES